MKINYSSKKLARQMSSASDVQRAFGTLAKKILQRKAELEAMPNLEALMKLPGPRCHPHTGDGKGDWSVDVSGNYRLIFAIDHDPIPMKEEGSGDEGSIDLQAVTIIEISRIEDPH